ncbi:MAG: metal ABC transporter substrate-binding protein [Dehalococcoidia bacterium]
MKSAALVLAGLVAVVSFGACGDGGPATTGSGINVVATTTQIGALTRAVAGNNVALTVLLSAGADAHDYEPDPQAVKKIGKAKVVLRNGLGLDDWLSKTIDAAGGSAQVVTVTDGIEVHRSDEGDPDPHVWHDPTNAKIMVDNIVAALSRADPENAALFAANGDAYKKVLDETDQEVRRLIDEIPEANRKVVTNHDAFGYFFGRYGLELIGAIIPSSSKDAQTSAKELADLQDLIKAEGVKAIFAEEEVDPKIARELAADTGVTIVEGLYADSLGAPGSGADTVDGMLLFNARKISEALK